MSINISTLLHWNLAWIGSIFKYDSTSHIHQHKFIVFVVFLFDMLLLSIQFFFNSSIGGNLICGLAIK